MIQRWNKTGRSISVVQVLWEHLGWVRLPAARMGRESKFICFRLGGERLFVISERNRKAPADVIGDSERPELKFNAFKSNLHIYYAVIYL